MDWIRRTVLNSPQPFGAYFHLLPPHSPYSPGREYVELFADGWETAAKPESTPITGIARCCARAPSGQAAAPATSVMNSRRFNRSKCIRCP